jgi:hypothetical protein
MPDQQYSERCLFAGLSQCRRRDSNPRHADYDSRLIWLNHREFRARWTRRWTQAHTRMHPIPCVAPLKPRTARTPAVSSRSLSCAPWRTQRMGQLGRGSGTKSSHRPPTARAPSFRARNERVRSFSRRAGLCRSSRSPRPRSSKSMAPRHHDARCPPGVLGLAGDLGALGPADVTPHAI